MISKPRELPILQVENLDVAYETRKGMVQAVRNVSFDVHRAETLGIVGESGCGKSTISFGIVNFLGRNGRITGGRILFQGQDLVGRSQEQLRELRGDRIAMVYQDPMQALNPSLRLGEQMSEVLVVHRGLKQKAADEKCLQMLERVYMPDAANVLRRFPHQISGGQQQRVVIAMALLNDPALLIMDEPTTALDVTVEAAVLDLVGDLQREFDTGIMYISHNLGVIARVSDNLAVMYAGELVERGSAEEVFLHPSHPYTQGLLRCVPRLGTDKSSSYLYPISGRVPPPSNLPPGCVFEPRCPYARPQCAAQRPEIRLVRPGHSARCLFGEEILKQKWEPPAHLAEQLEKRSATARPQGQEEIILSVEGAKTYYQAPSKALVGGPKQYVKAVDDVSFTVKCGRSLGIVGESGCGKSTLVKTIIGMERPTGGKFEFMGADINAPVAKRDLDLIRNLQMVFQNPDSTLNPSYSVGSQIARPLRKFGVVPRGQERAEVIRLLNMMKLGEGYFDRLPRQLSGGEKQRVGIAHAIAGRPDFLLCDEPVSALDVSVQAAVLNLILEIQNDLNMALIFIAHDLSVVRFFCDDIAVMYLGQIVEMGPADQIYQPPYHPYTEALLSAVPVPDPTAQVKHIRLSGTVPSALNPPSGCRFHTRCPRKIGTICETIAPPAQETADACRIYCHIPLAELSQVEPVITTTRRP